VGDRWRGAALLRREASISARREADEAGGRAAIRSGRGTVAVVDLETGIAAVVDTQ
jgi:hypothetical protein